MSTVLFSIEEHLQKSWSKFKEAPVFWIAISLFSIALGAPSSMSPSITVFVTIVSMYFSASITLMTINYMKGNTVSINDLIGINVLTFLHYMITSFLCGIAVVFGLIFLIIPGIYIGARLMFAHYLVVDQGYSFDRAISESWKMTEGNTWNLILLCCAMFLILVAGFLALLIGLLIAIPVTSFCTASIYLVFANQSSQRIEI